MSKSKNKSNGFMRYTTYNFVDKDPIIDVLRTMKNYAKISNREIAERSKVSAGTLGNWFGGKTKRPQFATVAAAASAMGYSKVPIDSDSRKYFKAGLK